MSRRICRAAVTQFTVQPAAIDEPVAGRRVLPILFAISVTLAIVLSLVAVASGEPPRAGKRPAVTLRLELVERNRGRWEVRAEGVPAPGVEVPRGAEVRVRLELDGEAVPGAERRVYFRYERFSATLPLGPGQVLAGEYAVRAEVPEARGLDSAATLRLGSVEDETAARADASAWLDACARDVLLLGRTLPMGRVEEVPSPAEAKWESRFLALREKYWEVVSPGRYFALYRPAEVREVAVGLDRLETAEVERRRGGVVRVEELACARAEVAEFAGRLAKRVGIATTEGTAVGEGGGSGGRGAGGEGLTTGRDGRAPVAAGIQRVLGSFSR
ncbi:MAG: hypothetical protein HYZ53_04135 [Planctomycetes bacterium]|nr:hypothetical protein [Planctomycetota bacterium]